MILLFDLNILKNILGLYILLDKEFHVQDKSDDALIDNTTVYIKLDTSFIPPKMNTLPTQVTGNICPHLKVGKHKYVDMRDKMKYEIKEANNCCPECVAPTRDAVTHLREYNHGDKPLCSFYNDDCEQKCSVFKKVVDGMALNMEDEFHMESRRHPPRMNYHINNRDKRSYDFNFTKQFNYDNMYHDSDVIPLRKNHNKVYQHVILMYFLKELIDNDYFHELMRKPKHEICVKFKKYIYDTITTFITHYEYDMKIKCNTKPNDESFNLDKAFKYILKNITILRTVKELMKHPKHKSKHYILQYNNMLAIRLYTGQNNCWVNMKETHFQHDYTTWKYFDLSLANSIYKLHKLEPFKSNLYSGLMNVNLSKESDKSVGYFTSYVSTSIVRKVAENFAGIPDTGSCQTDCCVLTFDKALRHELYCCDVSWISPHPDEKEVLFKRAEVFYAEIKNNHTSIDLNGIEYNKQTVYLTNYPKKKNKKIHNLEEYLLWRDIDSPR